MGLVFAVVGALPAVLTVALATVVDIPVSRWPLLAGAVLTGAVAMTLLGLTLGNALPLKAAVAVAHVLFLPRGFRRGTSFPWSSLRWEAGYSCDRAKCSLCPLASVASPMRRKAWT